MVKIFLPTIRTLNEKCNPGLSAANLVAQYLSYVEKIVLDRESIFVVNS